MTNTDWKNLNRFKSWRKATARWRTIDARHSRKLGRSYQSIADKFRSQCLPENASCSELIWRKKKQ